MNKLENINKKIDELKKEIIKLEEQAKNIYNYTSIIILDVSTTLKDLKNIKENIQKNVDVNVFEDLGIKKLAYEIKSQKEGCYIKFDFEGIAEDITKLEEYYRLEDNIIKFLNIKNENDED